MFRRSWSIHKLSASPKIWSRSFSSTVQYTTLAIALAIVNGRTRHLDCQISIKMNGSKSPLIGSLCNILISTFLTINSTVVISLQKFPKTRVCHVQNFNQKNWTELEILIEKLRFNENYFSNYISI